MLVFGQALKLELVLTYNVNGKHQAGHAAQGHADISLCAADFCPQLLMVFEGGLVRSVLVEESGKGFVIHGWS